MEVSKIIRPINLGITNPYIIECTNGKKYVGKFPGNPEGKKVLINEFVCANLAKYLGLPIPNYELATYNNVMISERFKEDQFKETGTVFCSEFLEKVATVPDYYLLTKVKNSSDVVKTLIFDLLIGNNDRNSGNFLVNFKNNSFVIIDHSHVFINGAIWDSNSLKRSIQEKIVTTNMVEATLDMFIQCLNIKNDESIKEFIRKVKSINDDLISGIINDIPNDWEIKNDEVEALKLFLFDRVKRINEILSVLNINGGE